MCGNLILNLIHLLEKFYQYCCKDEPDISELIGFRCICFQKGIGVLCIMHGVSTKSAAFLAGFTHK